MTQRVLQVHVGGPHAEVVRRLLGTADVGWWTEHDRPLQRVCFEVVVEVGHEEALLDAIEQACAPDPEHRTLVFPIEAVLPRVPSGASMASRGRVSRQELYDDLSAAARLSWTYVVTVALSTVVVTIGLMRNAPAIVIGGMVIAPLLGPNIALGLAATLADARLAAQALTTNLIGLLLALAIALAIGVSVGVDVDGAGAIASAEILARTAPHGLDLVLALAAGVAGTMAFTTRVAASLVGVMVAVALMPPLVVFGMCLAAARYADAGGALVLLLANVVCVNLAAVVTFLAQAIRPHDWWDARRSRRVVRIVVLALLVALAAVAVLVVLDQRRHA